MKRKKADPDDDDHFLNLDFARKFLFKEPRTRRDVATRKIRNQETSCSVVKATLNKFCKASSVGIRDPLNLIVKQVNQAIAEAYMLANLHVTRLIEAGYPLSQLDQSFFYGCLSAVTQAGRRKSESKDERFAASVAVYRSWCEESPGHKPASSQYLASGFHQQASLQMVTNTRTSVGLNFYRRFKKYLKHKYQLDGPTVWQTLRGIMSQEDYTGSDPIVMEYRMLMPTKPALGQIQDYPHLVLPLTHRILRYFEQQHAESHADNRAPVKQTRLFSLLPNKQGFECSHIKLCNNGLYGLLERADLGLNLPPDGPQWRAMAPEFWRRLFCIDKFETANRKFANEILTDGHSVSIVMRKPKTEPVTGSRSLNLDDHPTILGLDPGRKDLYTTCDLHGNHKHYSTRHFREAATYNASQRTIAGWMERNELAKKVNAGLPTTKSSHVELLKRHASFVLPVLDQMLEWHMTKPFRKLKLRRYIASKRILREMCQELTAKAGRETLVGFGDWSNTDSAGIIKKSPAGPVKKLEAELRKHCKVVSVDEFRTSKLHSACGCTLQNAQRHTHWRRGNAQGRTVGESKGAVKVHSVLHCANSGCSGICVNRDDNASLNILRLLILKSQGFSRPPQFCRGMELDNGIPAPFGDVGVWPVAVGFFKNPVEKSGIITGTF